MGRWPSSDPHFNESPGMKDAPEPIRLLRIIARLNVGGPAIHTILLTKSLSAHGFASTLVAGRVSPSEGDMHYFAEEQGVQPHLIPELGREIHWRNDLVAFWKLYRLMRALRPTIVHTHTAKAGMLGRLAAKLAGVPVIVHTFHGHVFHSYFSRRKTRIFLEIERFLARLTDAIITVSPLQREEILGYRIGRPQQVHAIGLGLDLEQFVTCETCRGRLRTELALPADVPLIGIVARLVPVKGHTYFLEAARHVLNAHPEARFVIVGDGELRNALEQTAEESGIRSHVHFLGFRRDLPEMYADLDVVVLSSLNEGLPVTLIEALAAGKPVVAANVGGVADLVQHEQSGFLVPPKDSTALAQGICQLLALPEQQRIAMGQRGRSHVYPAYHVRTLVKNLDAVYRRMLSAKGLGDGA
ncbi:glycosyltransferase [candidate division KSB3 bacterium]|uniref:Glycosyltransferase n=1 Tax=candidate division KSB3 bacterium TaxID=2044937 RepID=A0A9D5JXB3_9BACT|nr:glycosyltransferase [candidate division KSB3 bacterium]MBD3326027.1 glycosyltransferase [candidate division KSB3 bacterium]